VSSNEQFVVQFEHDWDKNTLEIRSESGYEMVVNLKNPFEVKGWRNLFESLGVLVEDETEE
jgi:hypothetical protein